MAGLDPKALLSAVALRLKDVPRFRNNVEFPRPENVTKSPLIIVINGASQLGMGTLNQRVDVQEWTLPFTIRTLVDTNGEAVRERDLLLTHLPLIVDAFDPLANGVGSVRQLMPSLTAPLSSFSYEGFLEGEVQYNATQKCYALDVYLNAAFNRHGNAIPIGGTP